METIKMVAGIIATIAFVFVIISTILFLTNRHYTKLQGIIIIVIITCCILLTLLWIPLKSWFGLVWLFNTYLWFNNYQIYKRNKE